MEEIWKEIDDRYSVSSFGRVKSNYSNKERIMKLQKNVRGYLTVTLRLNNKNKTVLVHRLVASAFIPNPYNLPEVNHKDEGKENNCIDNLEWCTLLYNCNYGTRNERKAKACRKKIFSVDEFGNVEHFNSVIDAGEITGINKTAISKVLSCSCSKNKTAGKRRWFYEGIEINIADEAKICSESCVRRVYGVDNNGNIVRYPSIAEAARAFKCSNQNICRSIKKGNMKCAGYQWYYEELQITNND